MSENQQNPFTKRVDNNKNQQNPFLKNNNQKNKPKRKISLWAILATFFISVIALVALMIFVLAVGGSKNPILNTFNIDPLFLKESLIRITNIAFGAISFVLFILLIIGVFRGLMAKKEESLKKKSSFLLSLFSFGMIFLTFTAWFGVFNFISKFVANAEPPAAEIVVFPSQKEILEMKPPIEITLSAEEAVQAWQRKRKKIASFAWDLNNDGLYEFTTQDVSFIQEFNQSGSVTIKLMVIAEDETQEIIEKTLILPEVSFDYFPKKGNAPLKINFDAKKFNNLQNPIVEYSWDFDGDKNWEKITDKAEISHTFNKIGLYTVHLRTKTITGVVKVYSATVEVLGSLKTVQIISPQITIIPNTEGVVPFTIQASGEKSKSPNGNIEDYEWEFGDTNFIQKGKVVDYTFKTPGTYNIYLTITDATGASKKISEKIIALAKEKNPQAKILNIPEILEGVTPFTVRFDASSSEPGLNNIVEYEWDINNDQTIDFRGQIFSHVFREAGEIEVKLIVRDSNNKTSETKVTVNVNSSNLTAQLKATPKSGTVPLTVNFDASESFYAHGQILSYEWDFGDGTPLELAGAQKLHKYENPGKYLVKLKIFTNDQKTTETSMMIYARTTPTQACFTASRHQGPAPLTITFDSRCSTGNISEWTWNFGDNSIAKNRKVNHVFQSPGNYKVILEVEDTTNNVSKYIDNIEVY